jgi:hypothetical protein
VRRKLGWAALGTSGVLAVAVAVVISTSEPVEAPSPKIIVPMAGDAEIDLPQPATTRPSSVFIDVPPAAVTSQTAPPPPVTPARPAVAAPKKASPPPPPGPVVNLALGKPVSVSGSQTGYPPNNATDGDTGTYWESTNNALPQIITVDLGAPTTFNRVTLKLPPSSAWGTRTQTLTISGGSAGGSYSTLVASFGYTFDPASGNTASAGFRTTTQRFVRLTITGNTGWPAGQVSELEIAAA